MYISILTWSTKVYQSCAFDHIHVPDKYEPRSQFILLFNCSAKHNSFGFLGCKINYTYMWFKILRRSKLQTFFYEDFFMKLQS